MSLPRIKYSNILRPPDGALNTCQHTKNRRLIFPEYNFTITDGKDNATLADSRVISYIGHLTDDGSVNIVNGSEKYLVYKSIVHKLRNVLNIKAMNYWDLIDDATDTTVHVIDISRQVIGKRIKPTSVRIVHSGQTYIDARIGKEVDEYVGYIYLSNTTTPIGFILYEYGVIVITDQSTISTYPNIGLTATELTYKSVKEIDVHNVFLEIKPSRYDMTLNETAQKYAVTSSFIYPVHYWYSGSAHYFRHPENTWVGSSINDGAKIYVSPDSTSSIATFSQSIGYITHRNYVKFEVYNQPNTNSLIDSGKLLYIEDTVSIPDRNKLPYTFFTTIGLYMYDTKSVPQLVGIAKLPRPFPLNGNYSTCLNITFDTKTF